MINADWVGGRLNGLLPFGLRIKSTTNLKLFVPFNECKSSVSRSTTCAKYLWCLEYNVDKAAGFWCSCDCLLLYWWFSVLGISSVHCDDKKWCSVDCRWRAFQKDLRPFLSSMNTFWKLTLKSSPKNAHQPSCSSFPVHQSMSIQTSPSISLHSYTIP